MLIEKKNCKNNTKNYKKKLPTEKMLDKKEEKPKTKDNNFLTQMTKKLKMKNLLPYIKMVALFFLIFIFFKSF